MTRKLLTRISASSLGFRLGMTLVLALMPLGVLSVIQTKSALEEVDQSTLEGVAGASLRAVQPQIDLIKDAEISARLLAATVPEVLGDTANCRDLMTTVANGLPEASLVAYIPLSGLMTCASVGETYDFSDNPLFQRLIAKPEPLLVYNPMGPVSGTAVIGVGHPVLDALGRQTGVVTISLPYVAIAPKDYADDLALWRPSYLATYTADGTRLFVSNPDLDEASLLPAALTPAQLDRWADMPGYFDTEAGRRIVSVTPIGGSLYLLSIWEKDFGTFWNRTSALTPYLLPALTWIAALFAAAYASGRLVVRHVRALSRAMSDYMSNRTRDEVPAIEEAPTEIQKLHAVYEELIRTINRDEAELQNLLVDKDILLREVNHRSGNSLQIIASVMRMYRRETHDDDQRAVLDGLINRVIALSSTHTSLYSLSGRRDVPMDDILERVVRRLQDIHNIAPDVTTRQLAPIRMPAEAAVPLALALGEIITCHFSAPLVAAAGVRILFEDTGEGLCLVVSGPGVPEFLPETLHGFAALPRRIIQQFVRQLHGQATFASEAGRSTVTIQLPRTG